eukprot:IDg11939t1
MRRFSSSHTHKLVRVIHSAYLDDPGQLGTATEQALSELVREHASTVTTENGVVFFDRDCDVGFGYCNWGDCSSNLCETRYIKHAILSGLRKVSLSSGCEGLTKATGVAAVLSRFNLALQSASYSYRPGHLVVQIEHKEQRALLKNYEGSSTKDYLTIATIIFVRGCAIR